MRVFVWALLNWDDAFPQWQFPRWHGPMPQFLVSNVTMAIQPAPQELLPLLLAQRILVLDGAMGTMIQQYKLSEEQYRGQGGAPPTSRRAGGRYRSVHGFAA